MRGDGKVFVVCHVVGNITEVQTVHYTELSAKKEVFRLKSQKGRGHYYMVESFVADRDLGTDSK